MAATTFPYVSGRTLNLAAQDGTRLPVTILEVFALTMCPVMVVELHRRDEQEPKHAVLKLFDRRFGVTRQRLRSPDMVQHTPKVESAWRDYVRSGKVARRIAHLAAEYRAPLPRFSENVIHQEETLVEDQPERISQWELYGEDECKVYHDLSLGYANEVRAYETLSSIQGTMIPRFLGAVTVDPGDDPPRDLKPVYFQIPGFLMQNIHGYPLSDLTWQMPSSPTAWEEVAQATVNVTREVCRLGVINYDCQPKNYIARPAGARTMVMMLDFGWVGFKSDHKTADGKIDEDAFRREVESKDCPGKIGTLMTEMIKNETGHTITITY